MAISSVLQTIRNAEIDARSLSEFVFKPADAMVSRRLAPSIHTLNYYLRFFDGAVSSATADANEIKQQLLSAQQQAQGTVSYIENTIRDAIDTTVIENSPISDALVSVDGTLSQRTINKGLESIADLSTINNPKDGLRVYVKSYHAGLGKGGGYFTYDSSKLNINDEGVVVNGWVRQVSQGTVSFEDFGASGNPNDIQTDSIEKALNNYYRYKVIGSGTYVYDSRMSSYVPFEITGKLIALIDEQGKTPTILVSTEGTKYDLLSPSILTNLSKHSRDIGIPVEYAGRYISIITSEKKDRYLNGSHLEYLMNYHGFAKFRYGHVRMNPRLPIDLKKEMVTEVRVHRLQSRMVIKISEILLDNSNIDANAVAANPAIALRRDNVHIELATVSQFDISRGVYAGVSVQSNGCSVTGGQLSHFSKRVGIDTYGILLDNCCNISISNIKGVSNHSSVAAGNAYSVTIRDCYLTAAGDHFGADWLIDSCVIHSSSHAGSDMEIRNTTILGFLSSHADLGWASGYHKVINCIWETSTETCLFKGKFNGDGLFPNHHIQDYDDLLIDGLTIRNVANWGTLSLYRIGYIDFSEVNHLKGWEVQNYKAPRNISIKNVKVEDSVDYLIGVETKNGSKRVLNEDGSPQITKIEVYDVSFLKPRIEYNTTYGSLSLFRPLQVERISSGSHELKNTYPDDFKLIDSEDMLKWAFDLRIKNVYNGSVSGSRDWRNINTFYIDGCDAVDFETAVTFSEEQGGSYMQNPFKGEYKISNSYIKRIPAGKRLVFNSLDLFNCYFDSDTRNTLPSAEEAPTAIIGCVWKDGAYFMEGPYDYWVNPTKYRQLPKQTTDSGSTASRPLGVPSGYQFFDTTLSKPIYWTGSDWVDSTGTAV